MPEHHPPEELLLEYAAGACDEALSLFVACHLTYCPHCRAEVAGFEALGGALLSDLFGTEGEGESEDLPDPIGDLAEQMARSPREAVAAPIEYDPLLPAPLLAYVGSSKSLDWQKVVPGVSTIELPLDRSGVPARLIRSAPGLKVPRHTHVEREYDLILAGGLHDLTRGGDFEVGDVQTADESVDHELEVLPGEDCIVLTVNAAMAKPVGIKSKFLFRLLPW